MYGPKALWMALWPVSTTDISAEDWFEGSVKQGWDVDEKLLVPDLSVKTIV